MVARPLVDVIDAVSVARKMARIELVSEVLQKWADEQCHIASVVQAVTRGNPRCEEAARKGSGA